jgi:predicted lipoprotein with Yx(FWY)xxD motif
MFVRSTGLTAVLARSRALLLRRDGAGRRRARLSGIAAALALMAGVAVVPLLTTSASASTDGVTISTASGPFGTMIVAGSGKFADYALYFITSDQPPNYGCKTTKLKTPLGPYVCTGLPSNQNVDWPALTTKGAPVAGPGVSQKLLGTVQRPGIGSQVTYAGHPLYLFDQKPLQVTGEGWDEPGIPPAHGLWYLISAQGLPLPWSQMIATTNVDSKTVLGATMVDGALHVFPVYSLSSDSASSSTCTAACAVAWPPLLTGGTPGLIDGLTVKNFGTLKRSDGTVQVTYRGKPLYLYSRESVAKNTNGPGSHVLGNGNGLKSPGGGTFSLVTP